MGDRAIRDAIDALRADETFDESGADATRDRVLASLARGRARRRSRVVIVTVLSLSLVGTAAWGWTSGWLPAAVGSLRGDGRAARADAPGGARAPAPRGAPALDREDLPSAVVEVPGVVTASQRPAPAVAAKRPRTAAVAPTTAPGPGRRGARAPRPGAAAVAMPVEPPADAEIQTFRIAHDLHFRSADPTGALAAWDVYLRDFPQGQLAPEARWNRAVLLLRLGRTDEARRALVPFASGVEGGYRQREAERLLERLGAR